MRLFVTYMEMTQPSEGAALPAPCEGVAIEETRLERAEYVALYRAVGGPLDWDQRLRLEPAALDAILAAPGERIFVLKEAGRTLGLCEFDAARMDDVELTHFGLVPEAQGRRLGPFLLRTALRAVWNAGARRIWLHTDTNDHPKAQATYRRAGFTPFLERFEDFPD